MGEGTPQSPAQTQAEWRAARGLPDVDLSGLAPGEVVAVNRYLRHLDDPRHRPADIPRAALQLYSRYAEGVIEAIGDLLAHDRDHGRAVFTALSESPEADDRSDVANRVRQLVKADHDFGLVVFERLLRDPSSQVRGDAYTPLESFIVKPSAQDEIRQGTIRWRDEHGLTESEVDRLQLAYAEAARGEGIYRLGEVVLRRLLSPTDLAVVDQSAALPDLSPPTESSPAG